MFSKKSFVCALLLTGAVGLPVSANATPPGFYMGIGMGWGDDQVLNQTSTAFKFFGGYNFNRYVGFEFGYVDLGNNYTDYYGQSFTQDGFAYELAGYLPVSPTIDLFAKGGFYNWTVSNNYYYYPYGSESGTNGTYGGGITAQLNRNLSLRGEYEVFTDIAGGDVNMASVSITYHF